MTLTTASVRTAAAAVCARDGADVAGLSRAELLELSHDLAGLRRAVDVALAQVAAEVDRRSAPADGSAGLAAREGFRSAGELIARATGGSVAEARRLVAAGELLANAAVEGAVFAPPSPLAQVRVALARAVREGALSVDAAAAFTSAMAGLPDTASTRDLFAQALSKAPGLAIHQVRKLVWRAQALADPVGWEGREERQYGERSAGLREDADGMVTLIARLTPLDAAPVRAVFDANVRWAMQQRRDDPTSDTRTPWQMRADILVDLCRHALDCDQPTSGVKTTVVVRMTREELAAGLGVGEVDGVAQPVSASALRQAAADAEVIPAILGGASEVLDWGRGRRLFTTAQRLALVERDGGCAWCNAPPSWCEAHHIKWWERDAGMTDLSNGVLLCTRCHHRIHRDGWEIEVRGDGAQGGVVWFTPPRSVDPARAPRLGGRERYGIAA
ncbi:HNH endonuclease [Demequina lutea]|uniref:HNH nuclease domain-containing protein n=1 Tax=Demequina lutea TaxID=431489 RepID=A0A7Y9ZBT7_9MICO|nr:HNH endonuclease signature motif containing protein [Demequina lutea]NYI41960.1 hypothetical protein [Demequina lutea]